MKLIGRDYDPGTGFTDETWFDEATGKMTLRRLQDVEATLADNKVRFNMHTGKKPNYSDSNGVHHVGRIPFVVIEKWMREDGFNWYKSSDAERRAKLNHPDNRKFLVRPGRL